MILDYKQIDPALLAPLDDFPPLEINRDNVDEVRAMVAMMEQPPNPGGLLETKTTICTADGDLDIYIYRGSERENQPALVWIHGGGYVLGTADDNRAMQIAVELDCTVFSVDYRLAPEYPFPAGPEDCYAALSWLMSRQSGYDVDLTRVALGGHSAGGGMAAGVILMNRDRDNFPLSLQLLIYPMIDNLHATVSGTYENHPVWNRAVSDNAWDMYLDGRPGTDASPYAAAFRAEDLQGLPPAYICVGTADLFRDENIAYASRLFEAGVPTELAVFPGLYHGGESFVPDAPVSERFTRSFMTALRDAFA
ncbi:MAG: alpha/beta hydrolase [Gammaproteobacteria bacterium]|nr:alpha/beta hydrolase [Gammaproteobacteria bacterium]